MEDNSWKAQLRYGKLTTPHSHFTLLADGHADDDIIAPECPKGSAIMAMKVWALSADQAVDVFGYVAKELGFTIADKIEIYDTEPEKPPREKPYGYDIKFSRY